MDYRDLDRRIAGLKAQIATDGESIRKLQAEARARGETVRVSAGGLTLMEQELDRLMQLRHQLVASGRAPASGMNDTQAMLIGFGAIGAVVFAVIYFLFFR